MALVSLRLVTLSAVVGALTGLAALAMVYGIKVVELVLLRGVVGVVLSSSYAEGMEPYSPPERPWLLPLVMALAGLVGAVLVGVIAPAECRGTDAAIRAYHTRGGVVKLSRSLLSLAVTALNLGAGGPAGREGAITFAGAGIGSAAARLFSLLPEERRVALVAGLGAGMAAIFRAPIGGALFALEVLYMRDIEAGALIPTLVASSVSYVVFASVAGWRSELYLPGAGGHLAPASLPYYVLLGAVAGAVGVFYAVLFRLISEALHGIRAPPLVKPTLAMAAVGALGVFFPQILTPGYRWMQQVVLGAVYPWWLFFLLALLKMLVVALVLGNGGVGGVFSPGLFIGGMVGAGLWELLSHVPGFGEPLYAFVVAGAASLFAAAGKTPLSVTVMAVEMSNTLAIAPAVAVAVATAYLMSGHYTVYSGKKEARR